MCSVGGDWPCRAAPGVYGRIGGLVHPALRYRRCGRPHEHRWRDLGGSWPCRPRGVKVMPGAGAQFRARLLEDLDAGFQRSAQFLPGVVTRYGQWMHRTAPMSFREEPFSASVTRPDCGESAYSHVTGQSECFREEAAPVCRRTCERHTRSLRDLLTCNAGRITRIWPLPARRLARPIAGGGGLGAGWGSPGGRRSR